MAGEDPKRLDWLRKQPCAMCQCPAHIGPTQAHHHTHRYASEGRGKASRKAADKDAFPLCLKCHHQFHAASGRFKDWTKVQRRAWQDAQVELYQKLYDDHNDPEVF